jgi:phosphatidylethanolamine/phosphatidyl-N-methylethanolamine N-methyltransferase
VAFAREFLRHPREVGSVLPSSSALGRAVADVLPKRVRTIAEFGPGTGPITRELLAKVGRNVQIVAFEIDPHFCEVLMSSIDDPRLTVLNRPAEDLASVAHELGVEFDAVVTSLPLVNFPVPVRNLILQAAKDALPPGGVIVGYTYTPYVVPRLMRETFGNCALRFVWRNVPPAFVFRSVR